MFASLQILILVILTVALFCVEAFAFVDAARRPAGAYVSAGKRTKTFWLALLGGGALLGFISISPPLGLGLLGLAGFFAVVPAMIYLGDVRKAIGGYRGPKGPRGGQPRRPNGGW